MKVTLPDIFFFRSPEHSSGYRWNEREDHQASLAGVPAVVVPGTYYNPKHLVETFYSNLLI